MLEHGALTIVGGGFLGCEVAASARQLGVAVDLVEQLAGPLVRVLGPVMAARITQLHLDHGVSMYSGVGVSALHGADALEAVELSDGRVLPARVALIALGVVPATSWLTGALTLAADGGICCDSTGLTSLPKVWAVGDAAAWGGAGRIEHWTSAIEQASVVARSVCGQPAEPSAAHYIWSDQYDATLQCIGEVGPTTEAEVIEVGAGLAALHWDSDDKRLLGVALLNLRKQAGRVRRLMSAGASLDEVRSAILR